MVTAQFPLDKIEAVISAGFPIRQFEVRNLTPLAVYLKAGGQIPNASNRDWVVSPGEERMFPAGGVSMLAYKLSSAPSLSQPLLICYDERQDIYQSLHLADDQCLSYPQEVTTVNAWVTLPSISPNGHVPVTFWVFADYLAGEMAMLLAHFTKSGSTFGGAQLIMACTRAGIFQYGMPENKAINPRIFIRQGDDPPGGPYKVFVDAWYSQRDYFWLPQINQYDLRSTPKVLGAAAADDLYYGLMPGYWDYSIWAAAIAGSTVATTATVAITAETYISEGGTVGQEVIQPTTNNISVPGLSTPGMQAFYRRLLTIQHPQIMHVFLTNTGAQNLPFITMMRKL